MFLSLYKQFWILHLLNSTRQTELFQLMTLLGTLHPTNIESINSGFNALLSSEKISDCVLDISYVRKGKFILLDYDNFLLISLKNKALNYFIHLFTFIIQPTCLVPYSSTSRVFSSRFTKPTLSHSGLQQGNKLRQIEALQLISSFSGYSVALTLQL